MNVKNALTVAVSIALITSASATVTMDWVSIGDINNPADSTGFGAVDYAYRIGKYEVTNAQYGEFLNAKAATDPFSLYHSNMTPRGITRNGNSGTYNYNVTENLANRPVVYVSWFDAARFANWLCNGKGNGDTETGAYTLNGDAYNLGAANAGAEFHIPTENEWYKAAYYDPSKGVSGGYWLYPNRSNSVTTADANYQDVSRLGLPTDVGSYSNDGSYYGTYDQGGNALEWTDGIRDGIRVMRGGAYENYGIISYDWPLSSDFRLSSHPSDDFYLNGFRLASVPEPTSMFLTTLASGVMLIRRKR